MLPTTDTPLRQSSFSTSSIDWDVEWELEALRQENAYLRDLLAKARVAMAIAYTLIPKEEEEG